MTNYPQNDYYAKEVKAIKNLVAKYGHEEARLKISGGNHGLAAEKRMYAGVDDLERRQTDAMAVEGDISDMGGW